MLNERIVLKQFPQETSLRTTANSGQHLSYSRHLSMRLNGSLCQFKQTANTSQESSIILRPSWNNRYNSQFSIRKDEMLKILKGRNYRLSVKKKKSLPGLQLCNVQTNKQKSVEKTFQSKVLKKLKRTNQAQKAALSRVQSSKKKWLQNERKFLVKTLRIQRLLDVQRVHYL